jgi:ADP-ribose pyrophosphatase YjhB (NUDIX family)
MKYEKFFNTCDVIIQKGNKIVLVERGQEPFKGMIELPGGHVDKSETVEQAAIREAKEETNLNVKLENIFGVYSGPKRDPRGPTVTTVFLAKPIGGKLEAGSDAKIGFWCENKKIPFKMMAFDHTEILKDYLKWRKHKGTYWSSKT